MKMKMKFLPAVFLVPLFLWVNALAWEIPIEVKGNGTEKTLYMATGPTATDGYDDGIDALLSPPPPVGFYTAFYIGGLFPYLSKDVRSSTDAIVTWTLMTTNATGLTDSISWHPADLPAGEFIFDTLTQNINMKTDSVAVYTGNLTLYIRYKSDGDVWTVSGTVELSDTPVGNWDGTTVTIGSYSDVTDANGDYAVTGIPSGTYTITVEHTGYGTVTDPGVSIIADIINRDYTLNPLVPTAIPIVVKGDGVEKTLYFGTDPAATDGYDDGIDELLSPPPPVGFYTAFYIGGLFPYLGKDMRPSADTVIIWTLMTTNATGLTDSISWRPADLPTGQWVFDTLTQKINMKTDSVAVYNGNLTLYMKYSAGPPLKKDVGGVEITSPPTAVYTDSTHPVTAKVANFGEATVSFDVACIINGYGDTVTVTNLAPPETTDVTFAPDWIAPSNSDTVTMLVYTLLAGDDSTSNDTLTQEIIISAPVNDVGGVAITSPPTAVYTDSTYTVSAKVTNFGETTVSFDVGCIIDGYGDTVRVENLAPPGTTTVTFAPDWDAPSTPDTVTMLVYTLLADDDDTSNDTLTQEIIISPTPVKNVGPVEIVSPPDSVATDSIYPVIATVANFGNVTVSFDVVCAIGTLPTPAYVDTQTVTDLAPNDTVDVNFTDWTAPSGTFTMIVATMLAGDENPANDTLSKTVGVEETPVIPTTYELSRAIPNPVFNTVQISYAIPEKGRVQIKVYDITGKLMATLKDAVETPGRRSVTWDMRDTNHKEVHSGVYFYRMEAGKFLSVRKILVVK